ncbi:UNVERIFIED_CONTAM: hypothetical protein GTU68_058394 [Idotea baltica]|nr:hypothetical protein [Idotea baltica]
MQFDSFLFVVFLTAVVFAYYATPNWELRKGVLLGASYLFYAAWSPPLIVLIWISTIVDYVIAKKIYKTNHSLARKLLLTLSLTVNLGLLGYFKYAQFLLDSFSQLLAQINIVYQAPEMSIILPIGISFYTFQTISYTVDVYRRQLEPNQKFRDFALYVTFFPQLVAGPIVRAKDFLPQCLIQPDFNLRAIFWGINLIIFGLFAKIVLADFAMAPTVDQVFSAPSNATTLDVWLGTIAFSGQIFFDFAGYTLCALGTAMILGFTLPDNFRSPYAATGFSDFWRRWHISLSSWIRDYVYIPLGGNRMGKSRTLFNLLCTMVLGGLWHGASWNFAIWGGLHGLYLIAEQVISRLLGGRFSGALYQAFLIILTFLLVTLAWVPFRAVSVGDTLEIFGKMIALEPGSSIDQNTGTLILLITLATLLWHAFTRNKTLEHRWSALPALLKIATLVSFIVLIVLTSNGDSRAFIYFQF